MLKYNIYAEIPRSIIDHLAVTDTNTEAERALILRTVNAVIAAAVQVDELKRIRAQAEAMEAWQADIGKFGERHAVMAGLLTRIARGVEKIANIPEE
jgi:hypothetical protein